MTPTVGYPRFSDEEHERRADLVRALLDDEELDALVVFGWSALGRALQADVHYLSGFLGMRDNYVLFPRHGEPVLFVQSFNHVPNAAAVSHLVDVRWGGVDSGATLGGELAARGAQRVGVVGMMPYQHHDRMRELSGAQVRDATAPFRRLRVVKSDEELAWLRRGAAHTDAAMAALREQMRPGMREYELADVIERAYTRDGGLTTFHYLASTPMAAPDRCVPAQVLSDRVLRAGDVVTTEISASHGGYAGQSLRTFVLEAEPTPLFTELHDVALEVFHAVVAAMRPGATEQDVLDAAAPIAAHGFAIVDALVHGFGIGILPPSIRTHETTHEPAPWTFEVGQTLVVQPNVVTADESAGVQVGELVEITADGARSMHGFPVELVRVGAGVA
ncbi:MAG TPA: Xaa-Pro peptidase family protein [Egicoccus sp.]|nr:Xaa-Pro peptidase family protein [Egicoccus sp.]HSK23054.1 Xaa-Pro peptidase family protein [Egicoccus sp.]